MHSIPRLCCSFAERPSKGGVACHNAAYRALGLNFTYVAFAVTDVQNAVAAIRALGIRGCGVTMPHKLAVLPYLDRLDPIAAEVKSVNTIVNDDGVLTGYNTDWAGSRRALEESTTLAGKNAIVVGAGGASRAIVHMLKASGASVHLYNRTLSRAEALVNEFGLAGAYPLDALEAARDCDLLINATPVGYHAQGESPIPTNLLRPGIVVFDIVAEPMETALLAEARQRGATCVTGHRMRLFQAAEQFRLYTGQQPPLDVMEAALIEASNPR